MRSAASSVAQGSFAQSLNQLLLLLQSFCGGISQASLDLLFGFGISDLHPIDDSVDLEGTAILRENS
jgi:hypothetical protein